MPIGHDFQWFRWSHPAIVANAPSMSGVYAIFAQRWIYVGESDRIQASLLEYVNGDNACITRNFPTGFQFELIPASQRAARQNQLILLVKPTCNQK